MTNITEDSGKELIARVCHQVNKAWCEYNNDQSQLNWNESPDWQKQSAMAGVTFHLQNPDATDSASHDNWMKDKLADGWTFGKIKNEELKTHPCIVPFNELPKEQQFKDKLFRVIVKSMVEATIAINTPNTSSPSA